MMTCFILNANCAFNDVSLEIYESKEKLYSKKLDDAKIKIGKEHVLA